MTTETNSVNLTAAQLEELRKADPSAYDLDPNDETLSTEGQEKPQGNEEVPTGDEVVSESAGEEPGDDAGTAERKSGHMIPKARFDEALAKEREDKKALLERLEAVEKQLKAVPEAPAAPADFAAEKAELRKKYDDGDIDTAEYEDLREALILKQARYEIQAEEVKRRQEASVATVQQEWDGMITTWIDANKEFMDNSIRKEAVERLLERHGADTALSNQELLEKVQKEAFEAFNWAGAGEPAKPGASVRDINDARAAAAASALPGAFSGGAGNRGTEGLPNIENIKPGEFSKLSKADQAKLLGGEAAV